MNYIRTEEGIFHDKTTMTYDEYKNHMQKIHKDNPLSEEKIKGNWEFYLYMDDKYNKEHIQNKKILKQSENILDLIDCFVYNGKVSKNLDELIPKRLVLNPAEGITSIPDIEKFSEVYGAVWIKGDLISQIRMDRNGTFFLMRTT